MTNSLDKLFLKKTNSKQIQKKLNVIGQKVLVNTYKEVKLLLKNDI